MDWAVLGWTGVSFFFVFWFVGQMRADVGGGCAGAGSTVLCYCGSYVCAGGADEMVRALSREVGVANVS